MIDGILNINKETGYTSHDVAAIVRKLTRAKCGHTGTLDPNATGVLPICIGKATKIADYIMAEEKEYVAEIIFGAETDTQDATGAVIAVKENFSFTEQCFADTVSSFIGEYNQIPPMYSAVKIDGKKLYELARSGRVVEREPRLTLIRDIRILSENLPRNAVISVRCSKGTYIRTLCSDIGKRLGTFAHMGSLQRTRSGNFKIGDGMTVGEARQRAVDGTLAEAVTPIIAALDMKTAVAATECEKRMYNGIPLSVDDVWLDEKPDIDENVIMLDNERQVVGIYTFTTDKLFKPKTILYIR